jgi:hypothetical protein
VTLTARVREFNEIVSPVLTDGGNDLAILLNNSVVDIPKVKVAGNDISGLGKNHRGATAGTLSMISAKLRRIIALVGEPRLVSGIDDTILQRDWTHPERRE